MSEHSTNKTLPENAFELAKLAALLDSQLCRNEPARAIEQAITFYIYAQRHYEKASSMEADEFLYAYGGLEICRDMLLKSAEEEGLRFYPNVKFEELGKIWPREFRFWLKENNIPKLLKTARAVEKNLKQFFIELAERRGQNAEKCVSLSKKKGNVQQGSKDYEKYMHDHVREDGARTYYLIERGLADDFLLWKKHKKIEGGRQSYQTRQQKKLSKKKKASLSV